MNLYCSQDSSLDSLRCWLEEIWLGVSKKVPFTCFWSLLGWLECLEVFLPPTPHFSVPISPSQQLNELHDAWGHQKSKMGAIAPPRCIITSATVDSSKQVIRLAQSKRGMHKFYSPPPQKQQCMYPGMQGTIVVYLCKPSEREWKIKMKQNLAKMLLLLQCYPSSYLHYTLSHSVQESNSPASSSFLFCQTLSALP